MRARGFVFASCYGLVASLAAFGMSKAHPLSRFNDIFLLGIVLTVYLFTWEPAVYLLSIAVVASAYVLRRVGVSANLLQSFYRIGSFAVLSLFVIGLLHRLKIRRGAPVLQPY